MGNKKLSELTEGYENKQEAYISILKGLGFKTENLKENINVNSKVDIVCKENHTYNSTYLTLLRGDGCKICCKLEPYYEIKILLESEGYEILNKSEDFKGSSSSKMEYKCPKGHVNSSVCSSLRAGNRCNDCGIQRTRELHRFNLEEVISIVENNGFTFNKVIGEYNNCKSEISITCSSGHTYDTRIENVLYYASCRKCGWLKTKGENHYLWSNGASKLNEYLRSKIDIWKLDSLKESDYTCYISGKKGLKLIVHHHKNFKNIVDEVIKELNLEFKSTIGEYEETSLDSISELCIKKHYEYGLGVVMEKEIHKLFHRIYGIKNNNMQQVNDFKEDYIKGKYN